MLNYRSSYKSIDGTMLGAVLDFPGVIAYGETLEKARESLASALRDMAETNLLKGEALPIPDPNATDPDAELEEPIHLILQAGQQVSMKVGTAAS